MSFAVFAIGALHALPPFLAAATTQSRTVAVLVGGASIFVGAAYGPTTYAGIDVAFAVLGTVIGWIIVPESGSSARAPTLTTSSTPKSESEHSFGDSDEEKEWIADFIYTVAMNADRIVKKRIRYWDKRGWTHPGSYDESERIAALRLLIANSLTGVFSGDQSFMEALWEKFKPLYTGGVITSTEALDSIEFDVLDTMRDEGLIHARIVSSFKEGFRKERRKARS